MDTLTRYRNEVMRCLSEWAAYMNRSPLNGVVAECAFDEERNQYLVILTGWHNRERVRTDYIHIRIRDGKIWIEEDNTESGIANELLKAGVPREDIVLAFHPPELRHLTEFAPA